MAQLLKDGGYDCACGRHHAATARSVLIERGAIEKLPEVVKGLGAGKPYLACDPNTWEAAGKRATDLLKAAGISPVVTVLRSSEPEPDEHTLGELAMSFDADCDLIIAVGSGVVNDVCKMLSLVSGRPSVIVGTAPSMDGFVSNSSSMISHGVKTTIYDPSPVAVVADTEIMAAAPMRMLWAGLGDMLAKSISVCEWRISNLITGEYYCEEVAAMMRKSLRQIVEQAEKIPTRDPDAIGRVAEGLVLSGVAMAYAGTSRPASGLEHYFSHMWEMFAIERGERSDLHGIQVGVGTLLTLRIYDWIKQIKPDREKALRHMHAFDQAAWEAQIRRLFGSAAGAILEIEEKTRKNDSAKHSMRLSRILSNWDEVLNIIAEELPGYDEVYRMMKGIGMPTSPADLGTSKSQVRDALIGARDIRDKYLSCSLLWDLGLLEEFADRLVESL